MTPVRAIRAGSRGGGPRHDGPFVRVLGPVQFVTADGATIDLPSITQRQVLAALALEPGATVRPELLCDRLGLTAGALRTTVSRLRGRMGADAIATDALGYRITCTTDAAIVESLVLDRSPRSDRVATLRTALDLWVGPALDEFRHEAWCEAQVFRVDELHDLAVEDLAAALIDLGRGDEAIADLEAHVRERPLRDRARGLQVRALASGGRQADALRAYQSYRRHLAEETGTEPSPAVAEIEHQVARGWNGREAPGAAVAPGPPVAADELVVPLPAALAAHAGLVGRVPELQALEAELAAVIVGPGARGVLIAGEAGIGKTTLIAAFVCELHAREGATIAYGRCSDAATDPLQPFRSVVGSIVAGLPTDVLAAHAQRCGGDLQRIAPGLAHRTWAPAPTRADEATERHQLFEAVADILSRAAQARPLVVVLEDLHWAEPTALLLFRHLVGMLGDARILLIASYRDRTFDQSEELRATLADLDRSGIRRLCLAGFEDEELRSLVAGIVGSDAPIAPRLLASLRRQTAGNPLYATQLTRHLVDLGTLAAGDGAIALTTTHEEAKLPANLADLVWSRVQALGGAAPAVLRSASVMGSAFDPDLLVEVSGATAAEVQQALEAGVDAGLLVEESEGDHRLRFVHGLVSLALYTDLEPSVRRSQHRRAADALELGGDHLPLRTVVQLARHRARAGDQAAALRWASLAGERAMAQLAFAEAAGWHRQALAHARSLERPDAEVAALLVTLGSAQLRAGDVTAAATLQEAAALARRSGAHEVLVDAALASDRGHVRAASVDLDQLELVEAALEVVDRTDHVRYARLLAQHAQELVHTARADDRRRSALDAVELSGRSDDPLLLAHLVSAITYGLWGPGTLQLRRDLARRAMDAARAARDPLLLFWSSRASYYVAIESADAEGAAASLARMRAISARVGEPRLAWIVATLEVFEATMAGRLVEGEALAEASYALGDRIGEHDALPIFGGQFFVLRSFAGRYEELVPLLEQMVDADPGMVAFSLALAIARAAVGRSEEAQAILDAGAVDGFGLSQDHYWVTNLVGFAVLAVELEDADAAVLLYDALVLLSDQVAFNGATSQGPVVAYLGKLASLLDRHDVAHGHLRAALAMAERCGWRYHEATTLVALARARYRQRGALGEEERAWIDRAEVIAGDCGLLGVEAQIADLTR